jgi:hypothetical protein
MGKLNLRLCMAIHGNKRAFNGKPFRVLIIFQKSNTIDLYSDTAQSPFRLGHSGPIQSVLSVCWRTFGSTETPVSEQPSGGATAAARLSGRHTGRTLSHCLGKQPATGHDPAVVNFKGENNEEDNGNCGACGRHGGACGRLRREP